MLFRRACALLFAGHPRSKEKALLHVIILSPVARALFVLLGIYVPIKNVIEYEHGSDRTWSSQLAAPLIVVLGLTFSSRGCIHIRPTRCTAVIHILVLWSTRASAEMNDPTRCAFSPDASRGG